VENILEQCLRSCTPIVWCHTPEEDRTALRVRVVSENLGYAVFDWTNTDAFVQLSQGDLRPPGDGSCTNINQALRAVGEYRHARAVFIFRDFDLLANRIDRAPDYVILIRQIKGLYRTLKAAGNAVVFIASSPSIPEELSDTISWIEAALPNAEERLEIIRLWIEAHSKDVSFDLDEEAIHRLVGTTAGMTSRQIQKALAQSAVKRKSLGENLIDDVLAEKVSVVKSTEVLSIVQVEETLDDVGGLNGIKEFLRKRALAYTKAAERYGLPKPKGILLLGLPGVGKTLMAKVSAHTLQMPLLALDIGRLQGSLVGQSEGRMRKALGLAESQAPCVLWVDEIDKAFGNVTGPAGDSGVLQRQFGFLLNWMQEHTAPVFMIATANSIQNLPPEFLRKGRFDEIFFVDLPTAEERRAILKVLLHKHGQNPKGLVTKDLVERLTHYTGAELDYVVIEALHEAFCDDQRPLSNKDLLTAATKIVPIAEQRRNEMETLRRWGRANARPAS